RLAKRRSQILDGPHPDAPDISVEDRRDQPNKAKPQTAREDRVHTPKLEGRAAVPGYQQELMAMEAPFFSPERTAGRREGEPSGRLVGDHLQLRGPPPSALLSARLEPAPEPRIPRFDRPYFDRVESKALGGGPLSWRWSPTS